MSVEFMVGMIVGQLLTLALAFPLGYVEQMLSDWRRRRALARNPGEDVDNPTRVG